MYGLGQPGRQEASASIPINPNDAEMRESIKTLGPSGCGDFLMTYDDAEGVWELPRKQEFDMELVAMKSTHHTEMTKLLIA